MNLTDDRGPQVIRAAVACSILSGLAFSGRIVSRKLLKAGFLISDYLLALGLLGAWLASGLIIWDAKLGLGKHMEVVPIENLETFLKTIYVQEICYVVSASLIKISILLFYREIFLGRLFEAYTYVAGAFAMVWGAAILLATIFSCHPISGFWDVKMIPPPRCINDRAAFNSVSSLDILSEVMILCLPIGKVWNLQMSRRSKAAISSMFMLGGFVIVASCLRLSFHLSLNEDDITWSLVRTMIWSCVEFNVAVMSACFPTMGPLVQAILRSSLMVRLLGNQQTKGVRDDKTSYTFNRSPRSERGEEFQRLPEYTVDCLSGPEVHPTYDSLIRLEEMALGERTRKGLSAENSYATQENASLHSDTLDAGIQKHRHSV